jgi:hypothetical protein
VARRPPKAIESGILEQGADPLWILGPWGHYEADAKRAARRRTALAVHPLAKLLREIYGPIEYLSGGPRSFPVG